jgi:uncharacterized protein YigE (DUF2233 family)
MAYLKYVLWFISSLAWAGSSYQILAPGLDYQDIVTHPITPWSHIHVFRIDPKHYRLLSVGAYHESLQGYAHEYALKHHAYIAINGGFFDKNGHPLGLRMSEGKPLSPKKEISWWGIFYIQDRHPHLASMGGFSPRIRPDFAIQSGPRLLIDGDIPSLKGGIAERSALAMDTKGHLFIIATEHMPISLSDFAHRIREALHCSNALNLDGGSSTQIYADIGDFHLDVRGLSQVSDVILIVPA